MAGVQVRAEGLHGHPGLLPVRGVGLYKFKQHVQIHTGLPRHNLGPKLLVVTTLLIKRKKKERGKRRRKKEKEKKGKRRKMMVRKKARKPKTGKRIKEEVERKKLNGSYLLSITSSLFLACF